MMKKTLVHLVPSLAFCRHESVPDDVLVDQYTHERNEEAFAELVRRHGPMVLGVCRRVLRNSADADDVFQATFMVLARKAGAIRPASSVGAWLHGVAFRTAREALRRAARRRAKESRVPPREELPEPVLADVRPVLDAELARLPKAFAQVLVLCDMEGRTRNDVAALLRVPEGTVASRLSRARALLAERLTRRGVALSAGAVATVVSAEVGTAASPERLAETARAAFAFGAEQATASVSPGALELANAVLGAAGGRFKLLVVMLVVSATAVTCWAVTTSPPPPASPQPEQTSASQTPKQPLVPAPVLTPRERITGQWRVEEGARGDRLLTDWEKAGFQFDFDTSGGLRVHRGQIRDRRAFTWVVESNAVPAVIVLTPPAGNKADAIRVNFTFRENALTLSWNEPAASRGERGAPAACRVTLSKIGPASAPGGVVVTSAPQNVAGSRLVGVWETDGELNKKLGHAPAAPVPGQPSATTLTFVSDPTVAGDVPGAYRTLFADKRVYLAGRMTVASTGGAPVSYRFLLLEHLGNATLVYFVPRHDDEWSCEEAVTVMLAPGATREKDLLFLTAFETSTHTPVGSFRRGAAKK